MARFGSDASETWCLPCSCMHAHIGLQRRLTCRVTAHGQTVSMHDRAYLRTVPSTVLQSCRDPCRDINFTRERGTCRLQRKPSACAPIRRRINLRVVWTRTGVGAAVISTVSNTVETRLAIEMDPSAFRCSHMPICSRNSVWKLLEIRQSCNVSVNTSFLSIYIETIMRTEHRSVKHRSHHFPPASTKAPR